MAIKFYELLGTSHSSFNTCDDALVTQLLSQKITAEQQRVMQAEVTDEEIQKVIFNLNGDKSPWPDGFTVQFFRNLGV